MANGKDLTQSLTSHMIVGDVGGGKSVEFLTLPGKKFLYVFEPNALNAIQGYDIEYESFIPDDLSIDAITLRKESGHVVRDKFSKHTEPKTYVKFEEDFETRLEDGFFDQFDRIGVDSTTGLQAIIMDRITFLNKRYGKNPEQDDYVGCTNTMINVFRALAGIGKPLFTTTHIDFKQDDITKRLQNQLFLIGRLRKQLPQLFSEIWLAYGEQAGDKKKFFVQTVSDKETTFLRCSSNLIKPVEEVTIDWTKPPEGQGIGALLKKATSK